MLVKTPLKYEELLKTILSQPSAPFREKHVIKVILDTLAKAKVPHFQDPVGNIVVGVSSKKDYLKLIKTSSKEPVRIFVAHMDHPGFHGVSWKSPSLLEFKWHGGSPTQHLEGAKVWLADQNGWAGEGTMHDVTMHASGRAVESGMIKITQTTREISEKQKATDFYGGVSFRAPYWQEGDLLYTKAADDLVGAFATLSVALDLFKKSKKHPFIALLTRAEEVGFIGAIGHFELGWLKNPKRPLMCVSLETSRTLPGAEIGKGPVVRLGDKSTCFDTNGLEVFTQVAKEVLPERHQRRVMDGGTCEGTAATVYGIPSIGISVPLGNYHNQSFEGGPDAAPPHGPAPEFVHMGDVAALIELCHALMKPKLPWAKPWAKKLEGFKKELKRYTPLLRSGP